MKNTINIIKNKKAQFFEKFCANKFMKSEKCYKFYIRNFESDFEGITKCPYGYACYFYKNQVISSIIDYKYCDLSRIISRNGHLNRTNFMKKNRRSDRSEIVNNVKVLSENELEKLIEDTKKQNELDLFRDTFHDLNNNNRSLKDIVEKLNNFLDEDILMKLRELFQIFDKHNEILYHVNDTSSKLQIYSSEIKQIDEIKNSILKDINRKNKKNYSLVRNLEFIDFRIRYLNRICISDHHTAIYKKELNVVKIITKLKHAFESTLIKKSQKIDIKVNDIEDKFRIIAYDDIYLGFFILLENAIKYAPMNSQINVFIINENNNIKIIIDNQSNYIGKTNLLVKRGIQGENCKDGNGFGLSIAYDIFCSSNMSFTIKYENNHFICVISKNELCVISN